MRELGLQFKEIQIRTGVAISTASDIHRQAMKNAIAKREAALPNVLREAELEEVWIADGFGVFELDEELSVEEMIQAGWCYGGSNIRKTSEYTRPVRLKVWRIRLGRRGSKNRGKR